MHISFIAALFIRTKTSGLPKGSSADEWLNIICYAHEIEYYFAMERGEVHAISWINVRNMQNEEAMHLKVTYFIIPSI